MSLGQKIPSKSAEGKRAISILVVEDNLVNQRVLCKQLRKAGHTVYVANHGVEALELIRSSCFWSNDNERSTGDDRLSYQNGDKSTPMELDVVLMDLEMPVMNGITCVSQIREDQRKGKIILHLPVIAVTANARKDHITDCLEAGMDEVTTKPYRISDILSQVESVVAKYPNPTHSDAKNL